MNPVDKKFAVIDLFAGCGGLSHGFIQAGFDVKLGIDMWPDALSTYARNHPDSKTLNADLSKLTPAEAARISGITKADVIIGGPPCQGFSVAGKHIIDDVRNKLYKSFVAFVKHYSPRAFVMENVPQILTMGGGVIRDEILADFRALGYTVEVRVLCAADYGVPQNRRRAIFVGLKNEQHFSFPAPTVTEPVSSSEAISDLPDETLPDGVGYNMLPLTPYQRKMREGSSGVFNHQATVHTEKTRRIIAMVPDGGNYLDLPKNLQDTRKVHIAWTRLRSDKPSITIDTGHNHHFHYSYNRVPTARESARLQSFPDSFVFLCGKTSQLKQVGNAVPPLLAEAIARQLRRYL